MRSEDGPAREQEEWYAKHAMAIAYAGDFGLNFAITPSHSRCDPAGAETVRMLTMIAAGLFYQLTAV